MCVYLHALSFALKKKKLAAVLSVSSRPAKEIVWTISSLCDIVQIQKINPI